MLFIVFNTISTITITTTKILVFDILIFDAHIDPDKILAYQWHILALLYINGYIIK